MKKLLTCFFAIALVAPVALAADGAISRAIPTASNTDGAAGKSVSSRTTPATTVSRMATRTVSTSNATNKTDASTVSPAPNTARTTARVITVNPATSNDTSHSNTLSRSVAVKNTDDSTRGKLDAAVNTVGRNARVSAASINNNPALRRAGITLRPSTAEVGGRATISETGAQTGSNVDEAVRGVSTRAASNTTTRESLAEAKERLEQTAELNKSCQEQYNECMDQFCAVIDSNQKRCSCSANLSRYTKVEEAVTAANTQLNEVAQRIRYVGLSADEIRAIMTETEAEETLNKTTDTSESRSLLEEIEEMIKDPTSSASYADTSTSFDMDLDFSSDSADLFSLDFLSLDSSSSFSNLRGRELYNAAKKRCKTVLNQCKSAGATADQITGNYDLAIDKDCVAYEQGLEKMNETLTSNVRSANLMLQKARLAVLQNKNQYDAKGCIAALDTCMRDDMVCGDNYYKCVDPTKKYIDENGAVVLGQDITQIPDFMASYNNANINDAFLRTAYKQPITDTGCSAVHGAGETSGGNDGSCVVRYLLQKIGVGQKSTDGGLCRAVLDKCQAYTYNGDKYDEYNDIVVNYIQRAMVNIKAAQQSIIADYASTCMSEISTCYNQQVTQINAWTSTANLANILSVMRGACRNVALTCAYAVFANDDDSCPESTVTADNSDACIDNISQVFYQSLLCPDNSTYLVGDDSDDCSSFGNGTQCVNEICKCNAGYEAWGNACYVECHGERNAYGTCVATTPSNDS